MTFLAISLFFIGLIGLQAHPVKDIDGIGSRVWMAEDLKSDTTLEKITNLVADLKIVKTR